MGINVSEDILDLEVWRDDISLAIAELTHEPKVKQATILKRDDSTRI